MDSHYLIKRQEEEQDEARKREQERRILWATVFVVVKAFARVVLHHLLKQRKKKGRLTGSVNIKRKRRDINEHFASLGPDIFRKMYRMNRDEFEKLHELLLPRLPNIKKRSRGGTPNGDICSRTRLCMALRFCAGGDKYDISATHVVHPNEVYKSLWLVVDAINNHPFFDITFPSSYEEQQKLADDFAAQSKCGFTQCCAAVDGMLVWMNKPIEKINDAGIGPGRFYDGRKKKFGLNMQGTVDSKRRFLDVFVRHPGSAGDFTVWLDSPLREMIEEKRMLKPGLVLFGDNAYINTPYMVCPFKGGNLDNAQDAFNHYHSNLRITVECAFGMLVHRWGCLRKPIPMHWGTHRVSRLVHALCKLHNYCIDCNDTEPSNAFDEDNFAINRAGGFTSVSNRDSRIVNGLIGGDNSGDNELRKEHRRETARIFSALPISSMLEHIREGDYRRPPPEKPKL
jgi:hypothetical protein